MCYNTYINFLEKSIFNKYLRENMLGENIYTYKQKDIPYKKLRVTPL